MKSKSSAFLIYLLVVGCIVFITFPLIWMILTSLKSFKEIFSMPPSLFPHEVTFKHYLDLLRRTTFDLYFRNSLIVSLSTTILCVAIAVFGAYSLTRFRYAGRKVIANASLAIYMFPPILLSIPLFVIISGVGLANTYASLVFAHTTFGLPFSLWILRSFFQTIPIDIEEAAMVDGASRVRVLLSIIFPLALPGIIAAGIFVFILSWNDYLFALIFMVSDDMKTLPIGIADFIRGESSEWGLLMAGSVVVTLPVLLLFMFIQKYLVQGLGAGAVKG